MEIFINSILQACIIFLAYVYRFPCIHLDIQTTNIKNDLDQYNIYLETIDLANSIGVQIIGIFLHYFRCFLDTILTYAFT